MKWVSLMVGSSESPSVMATLSPFEELAYKVWTTTDTSCKNKAVTMTEQAMNCS